MSDFDKRFDFEESDVLTWGVDDILVTENGYENLTTAPKTVEEMERIINS